MRVHPCIQGAAGAVAAFFVGAPICRLMVWWWDFIFSIKL